MKHILLNLILVFTVFTASAQKRTPKTSKYQNAYQSAYQSAYLKALEQELTSGTSQDQGALLTTSAQKLTIESFVQTSDAIARTRNVVGTDGNVCAAVVVRVPSANATFNGGFILNKPTYKDGEYILDMQTGAAQMRVSVPGYNTIDVKFRDYLGSTLQSKTTYLLTINLPQTGTTQQKMQTLNIKVAPSDAIVQIDGEIVDGNTMSLAPGTHRYNVAARGYHTQEGTIEVRENSPAKLLIELDRKQTSDSNNTATTVQAIPLQSNPSVQQSEALQSEAQQSANNAEHIYSAQELNLKTLKLTDWKVIQGNPPHKYGIVIGSFSMQKSATNLFEEHVANDNPDGVLIENNYKKSLWYRVVILTSDDALVISKNMEKIRKKYEYAWVAEFVSQ